MRLPSWWKGADGFVGKKIKKKGKRKKKLYPVVFFDQIQ
jgi:hypothetical protein